MDDGDCSIDSSDSSDMELEQNHHEEVKQSHPILQSYSLSSDSDIPLQYNPPLQVAYG